MFQKFIDRPVLSTVISIIIVILGVLGLSTLPIEEYPEIAPPTVQVTSTYTGANAETVLKSVVVPLEEQINGVEDMLYMTSNASNDGSATINVYFKLGTDPDIAAVNVQNRVARANSVLPQAVIQTGVITQKSQTSALLFFSLLNHQDATTRIYNLHHGHKRQEELISRLRRQFFSFLYLQLRDSHSDATD